MRKLLVANWKMNPETEKDALRLAKAIDKRGVVVCPPFPFLAGVKEILKRANLGAQDVFGEEKGAYTGEVSAQMLKNLGVKYIIVGHSERRRLGETDAMVNKKIRTALRAGLKVILCVGEPLTVRRKGLKAAKKFVANQLKEDLKSLNSRFVVAYEPIWAIGTGRADKPPETAEMSKFIKHWLLISCRLSHISILYGGSVNSQNAGIFLKLKDIDGALVGGASIKAAEFNKIIKIANGTG